MIAFINGYSNKLTLTELWKDSFGDSLVYLDKMYENGFLSPDVTYVLTEDGRLLSALCALEYPMHFNGKPLRAAYICNAATGVEFQHNGYMKLLLERTCDRLKAKGFDAVSVIPASDELFSYYAEQGFETAFYIGKKRYEEEVGSNLKPMRLASGSRGLYEAYRKRYASMPFGYYKSLIRFTQAIDEYNFSPDCGFYSIGNGFAFLVKGEEITVREYGGISDDELAASLMAHYHRPVVLETFPEDRENPIGMIRFLKDGLTLDRDVLGYMNCMLN